MTELHRLASPEQVALTVDDFLLLERSGAFDAYARTELIDGVIVALNSQWVPHARAKMMVAFAINDAVRTLSLPLEVYSEVSVKLGPHDLPMPDVLLCRVLNQHEGPVPHDQMLLAIEISDSTLAFDLGVKATVYARQGIPEYWVVDLKSRIIHQMSKPAAEGYETKAQIAFGMPLRSVAVPPLEVPTTTLL